MMMLEDLLERIVDVRVHFAADILTAAVTAAAVEPHEIRRLQGPEPPIGHPSVHFALHLSRDECIESSQQDGDASDGV